MLHKYCFIDFTHDLMQPLSSEASGMSTKSFFSRYQSTSKLPQYSEVLQQDTKSDKVYYITVWWMTLQ